MRSRFEQSYEIYREGVGLCNGRAKKFVVLYLDCAERVSEGVTWKVFRAIVRPVFIVHVLPCLAPSKTSSGIVRCT